MVTGEKKLLCFDRPEQERSPIKSENQFIKAQNTPVHVKIRNRLQSMWVSLTPIKFTRMRPDAQIAKNSFIK